VKRFKSGTPERELVDVLKAISNEIAVEQGEIELVHSVDLIKAVSHEELRYTLGPMYAPMVKDAHGEYADDDDLRKAVWDYNLNADRSLRKQHGLQVIGNVIEMFQWPFEHDHELMQSDGTVRKVKLPAGTVYSGVQWSPSAWQDVKKGKIKGYSMGGAAVRLKDAAHDSDLLKLA
jgi:hypothetical protein